MSRSVAGATANLGDVAYQRKFEIQHREVVETLNRQLIDAEKKLQVGHNQRLICVQICSKSDINSS